MVSIQIPTVIWYSDQGWVFKLTVIKTKFWIPDNDKTNFRLNIQFLKIVMLYDGIFLNKSVPELGLWDHRY